MIVVGQDAGRSAAGDFEECVQTIGGGFVRPDHAEVRGIAIELHHVAQHLAHFAGGLGNDRTRFRHGDRIAGEIGHLEVAQQQAAVGVRGSSLMRRCPFGASSCTGISVPAESNSSRAGSSSSILQACAGAPACGKLGERYLMRAESAFDLDIIDDLGAGPAFGVRSTIMGQRALAKAVGAGFALDGLNLGEDLIHGGSHELVHGPRLVARDEMRPVAAAMEKVHELFVGYPREQRDRRFCSR